MTPTKYDSRLKLTKELTHEETVTVLAALRYWQQDLEDDEEPPISEHFEDGTKPLTPEEIDALCEAINLQQIEGLNPLNAEAARIAKEKYADPSDNDIEIDDGPHFSDAMPEGIWVSAWLWAAGEELRKEFPFVNHYEHCGVSWNDEAPQMSNDRCPKCNAEIEPHASTDTISNEIINHTEVKP